MLETGQGLIRENQKEWAECTEKAEEEDVFAKLSDQKVVYEAQAKVTAAHIDTMLNKQADALQEPSKGSNFEELD